MRIGIEAQRIFREKKHGMDIVAIELIKKLQEIDEKNEYFIFVQDDSSKSVIKETQNFKIVYVKQSPYPIWEQVWLKKAVDEYKIDLLHCTSNTAPVNLRIPFIVTIHDIIYLEKLNFSKGTAYQIVGNLYRRWNVPLISSKAFRILTVSDFENVRIGDYFGFDKDKIVTVHNGVSDIFKKVEDQKLLDEIRLKYKLPEKFIFCLGNTDPKKNMVGILRAISILRQQGKLNFKLLLLDIDRRYLMNALKSIGDIEILEYIHFSGYIPNNELPAIYSMAELFIYPSLRESFGIPILEAMACGTPVVTSLTSSMPEVAGDAAFLIDPYNPSDIANGIDQMMTSNQRRELASIKGIEQAKRFSWKRNAQKTLELYNLCHQQMT